MLSLRVCEHRAAVKGPLPFPSVSEHSPLLCLLAFQTTSALPRNASDTSPGVCKSIKSTSRGSLMPAASGGVQVTFSPRVTSCQRQATARCTVRSGSEDPSSPLQPQQLLLHRCVSERPGCASVSISDPVTDVREFQRLCHQFGCELVHQRCLLSLAF